MSLIGLLGIIVHVQLGSGRGFWYIFKVFQIFSPVRHGVGLCAPSPRCPHSGRFFRPYVSGPVPSSAHCMYWQWWMGTLVLVAHSRDQPWGVLESLSHAVPQWVCGGWVILNDLLTDYILSSGSTFWEGLQWPGRSSQVSFCWHTLQ